MENGNKNINVPFFFSIVSDFNPRSLEAMAHDAAFKFFLPNMEFGWHLNNKKELANCLPHTIRNSLLEKFLATNNLPEKAHVN